MRKSVLAVVILLLFSIGTLRRPFSHKGSLDFNERGINVIEVKTDSGEIYNFLYDSMKFENILDNESKLQRGVSTLIDFNSEQYVVIDEEIFNVKDLSIAKNNVEKHTGEVIDGVINSQTLNNIDQKYIKLKNYKTNE